MPDVTRELVAVNVPGTNQPIMAVLVDGRPFVPLKPMCQTLGLDAEGQRQKLDRSEWAVTCVIQATGTDGKRYQMVALDADHIPMWLATIATSRVAAGARPVLVAYQREAATVLRDHFYGPPADILATREHEANAQLYTARAQIELCQAAKGLIHPDHLEAKARVILARGLGEHAELDSGRKPLYINDYLKSKNLTRKRFRAIAGNFHKQVKATYVAVHGRPPATYPLEFANGQTREVAGYTEADRDLMDRVWNVGFDPNRPSRTGQLSLVDGDVIA